MEIYSMEKRNTLELEGMKYMKWI